MTEHRKNPALRMRWRRFAAATLCVDRARPDDAALGPMQQDLTLNETGSTLLYPLFTTWVDAYTKSHPGIHITVGGTGSEAGIQQVLAGKVQIGASDAYMSDADMQATSAHHQRPARDRGADHQLQSAGPQRDASEAGRAGARCDLHGHGPQLGCAADRRAQSGRGVAASRDRADSPGGRLRRYVRVHPVPVVLDAVMGKRHGYGTTIAWPSVPGSTTAVGNAGMVQGLQNTPYSIGYVGVSFTDKVTTAQLGTAALKNGAGEFVTPSKDTITAGAASLGPRTPPDERLSLVFAPASGAYPLVNYEYAVVSTKQSDPATAAALRRFLLWSIVPSETNEAYLDTVHFIPLPPHTWELSQAQIQTIK